MQASKYFLLFCSVFLISCSSAPNTPNCVSTAEKDLEISWGNQYNNTGWKVYHSIYSNLIMVRIEEDSLGNKKYSDSTKISADNYCQIKHELSRLIIKIQAMNYPGIVQQFVEYKNNGQNIYFRAIWNQEYADTGYKKEFKAFFDSLTIKAR